MKRIGLCTPVNGYEKIVMHWRDRTENSVRSLFFGNRDAPQKN